MGFFSKMLSRINARDRFKNAGNMNRRIMPSMFGRMGGGIGSMFPRFRPPTIEEAKGRNMANVGLLPDYMQPGGSGMPDLDITTDAPIRISDILPRDPGFSVNLPKRRPVMTGVVPQPNPITYGPVTPPPGMLKPVDLMPTLPNNLPQQPPAMMDMQGRRFMKDGGEAEKYPNEGLAALAKVAPEVVERMGYEEGGPVPGIDMPTSSDADMLNYRDTLTSLRNLIDSLPSNQQIYFEAAVKQIMNERGRTLSEQDKEIAESLAPASIMMNNYE